jgi:hypothetical protein
MTESGPSGVRGVLSGQAVLDFNHPAWWRRFTADFTTRMITSTQPAPWAA